MDALQLIISFLGGGIIGGLINWARAERADRASRKSDYLKEQLKNLYGPLYFFAGQNESLFELNFKFHKAYNKHYVNQNWSKDPATRESLREETTTTIELANYYVGIVRENNRKITEILRSNYAFIDPEDTEIFKQFVIDHLRMEQEFQVDKPLKTPFGVYMEIGEISYSRPEFVELTKQKFTEKSHLIKGLQ